jgi:hypothetical protein
LSTFSTGLTKITDTFAPMIEQQLVGNGIQLDPYSKQCVVSAISAINAVLDSKGLTWNDPALDKNNVTQILMNVAALKLNASASPREVYFQMRNVNVKAKPSDQDNWKKQIEMGIEGDGNDAILNNFGRNVKQVRPYWAVREGDLFEYPSFNGLDLTPPKWSPKGQGDVIRIVYPIIFNDDSIQYFIAEVADVAKNLVAHMSNSMMNETFGILSAGKTRYDANADQKKKITEKKSEILKKAKELGLDALDDPEMLQYISPAWSEYQSRESMLIRKMRNNIVKKIPKDFGSSVIEMIHSEVTDDTYASVRREIADNANSEPIDINPEPATTEPPADPIKTDPIKTNVEGPPSEPVQGDLYTDFDAHLKAEQAANAAGF